MPLEFNEIRQLLATIAQTDIAEVTLKSEDFELTVRKSSSREILAAPNQVMEVGTSRVLESAVSASSVQLSANPPSTIDKRLVEVPSPMVGTFYSAPAPGEAAFVKVGDRVRVGQTVCIIEAMKLMNEIEAEVSGQVMEILLQNGEPVEYGQALMRINPD
ncbi:acetyl-CoA carboxylase biotin carboxyl carrier protein [Nodularia sp. UHCC 0506]|uniref:acetyl-CoA carboxylase biotin carboxyl carrier protein n=1 Tax=Nodularia sp. UHCC 0506 TaxID=3110243 RepID=UPI002B1EEC95|nr:acetyl-CoA carboxylase biotin carboxyl carrier protein [Nodularia sp. UHCC 0506]MEA5513361.1 acetyl-CoA carboxylase biotin carboxyl carrier protein [Nodularia sp. UHCC 0506]